MAPSSSSMLAVALMTDDLTSMSFLALSRRSVLIFALSSAVRLLSRLWRAMASLPAGLSAIILAASSRDPSTILQNVHSWKRSFPASLARCRFSFITSLRSSIDPASTVADLLILSVMWRMFSTPLMKSDPCSRVFSALSNSSSTGSRPLKVPSSGDWPRSRVSKSLTDVHCTLCSPSWSSQKPCAEQMVQMSRPMSTTTITPAA
mmetsp:Transcript_105566/g.315325  ORF Transcript_105566/g.315325 Transcript_105566/m.315325 type:complete len:205 (+) Transcript_105566:1679-2293(+)